MMTPLVHLDLPETADGSHFAPIQILLEGMCKINEWYIRRSIKAAEKGEGLPIPPLYESGVRYKADPPGREDWKDCRAVLRDKHGDCDRLVAWRVGELRAVGIAAEPVLKWQWVPRDIMLEIGYPKRYVPKSGVWLVHCLVRWPDGSIEDPSKILGMKGNFLEAI